MKAVTKKITSVKLKGWDFDDDTTVLIGSRFRGTSPWRRKLARQARVAAGKKPRKTPPAR